MKSIFVSLISLLLISSSEPLRIELQYDNVVKELQIHVEGKQIELVQIFANEKLLVEFDSQQILPWDSTIRLKMTCPEPCRFYYLITTKQGAVHRIKSKRSDLSKHGTFCEVE